MSGLMACRFAATSTVRAGPVTAALAAEAVTATAVVPSMGTRHSNALVRYRKGASWRRGEAHGVGPCTRLTLTGSPRQAPRTLTLINPARNGSDSAPARCRVLA